jgi:RNA polymerase sigma-70 factor (ECF subfamily)
MLFGCCHPALSVEARLALTLRAVVGMTTQQIASAFLVPEATMAQRLVRAKRKITSAGIPFTIPYADDLAPRLDDVLTVIYLSYNAGYLEPSASGREMRDDAIWLAELVARALPDQAEAWGLLALLTFLASRTQSRFDDQGRLVLLEDQDRRTWDGSRSVAPTVTWPPQQLCTGPVGSSYRRRLPAVMPPLPRGPRQTGCRS